MSIERKVRRVLASGEKFHEDKFKTYMSEVEDVSEEEVQEAIRELEKDGDIFRPREDQVIQRTSGGFA